MNYNQELIIIENDEIKKIDAVKNLKESLGELVDEIKSISFLKEDKYYYYNILMVNDSELKKIFLKTLFILLFLRRFFSSETILYNLQVKQMRILMINSTLKNKNYF